MTRETDGETPSEEVVEEIDGLFIEEDDDDAAEDPAAADGSSEADAGGESSDADAPDEAAEPDAPDELAELRAQVEALEAEKKTLHDRLLRTAADLENSRRRHQKERDDLRRFGGESVLKGIVVIVDDLERALEHVRSQSSGDDTGTTSILEGIEMVFRKFLQTLERMGVTPVDAKGSVFDPHHHEAIQQVSDPSVPNNTVVQVFQKGYMLHDRLLRPALVVVAQGGPPAETPAEESGDSLESEADSGDNQEP